MKLHDKYYYKDEEILTISYQFDTEEEMNASGLLDDPRRTSCFMSSGKYYVCGHFAEEDAYDEGLKSHCKGCSKKDTLWCLAVCPYSAT